MGDEMTADWSMGIIKTCLLDLLSALEGKDFPVILCGGFGLYLKQLYLQSQGQSRQSLLPADFWPRPRTTEDMDVLVRTEVVADAERFRRLRTVLDDLEYVPIPGAEYMQFVKQLGTSTNVKIDLLTGPIPPALESRVVARQRRIRPAGQSVGLHAHRADEAMLFEQDLLQIPIDGNRSDGQPYSGVIFVPPAITFLSMKLHAFQDRADDQDKDFARGHALDLYRVVAMLSYQEFQQVRSAIRHQWDDAVVQNARRIVTEHFSDATSLGLIRLRQHDLFEKDMDTDKFCRALVDLFKAP